MGETGVVKESEEKAVKVEKTDVDKKEEPSSDAKEKDSKTEIEIKNENESQEISELEGKIIRQVEYYFGDHNLVKDKFLQSQVKENDGWVNLSVLVTFNRLKSLSDDTTKIIAALKKSSNKLIQINEEETKIRRHPDRPLPEKPENWKEEQITRTVYAKGFPVDSTMDMLMDFFKEHGTVENLFMKRKFNSQSFKGSVFATFITPEEAEKFVEIEGQKYKNSLLIKEMKVDYQKRKQEEFLKRKEEREKRKQEKADGGEPEKEYPFNPEEDMVKGSLLKLSGFATGTTREHIKDVFNNFAKVAYIEFRIGDEEGVVRFAEAGVAKDALEKSLVGEDDEKKLMIKETAITYNVIDGDDEVEYWKKLVQARNSNKDRRSSNRERRNFHKRGGGRGGSRGRGRGDYRGRGGRGRGGRGGGRYFDRNNDWNQDGGADRKNDAENNGDVQMETAPAASDRKRPAEDKSDAPPAKQEKVDGV